MVTNTVGSLLGEAAGQAIGRGASAFHRNFEIALDRSGVYLGSEIGGAGGVRIRKRVAQANSQLEILDPEFVPTNATRRNFGTLVHQDVPAGMLETFPSTSFRFNVGPGQTGPDVEFLGRGVDPGFDFADLKPRTPSGFEAFQFQIQAWADGRAGVFFYDPVSGEIDFESIFVFK